MVGFLTIFLNISSKQGAFRKMPGGEEEAPTQFFMFQQNRNINRSGSMSSRWGGTNPWVTPSPFVFKSCCMGPSPKVGDVPLARVINALQTIKLAALSASQTVMLLARWEGRQKAGVDL